MSVPLRRGVLCATAALSAALLLGGCGASSPGASTVAAGCTPKHASLPTIAAGTLTVAAYVSPPYTVQSGSDIEGVDGLIMKAVGQRECVTVKVSSVAGAALPSTITSKRADVAIGGVYASKDRAATFSLTTPMYHDGLALLSASGVNTLAGLQGKKLGVIQGYLWNDEFSKALGADSVTSYQTSASMIADIKNGRVDAGAFTTAESGLRAKEDPSLKSAVLQPTPQIAESQTQSDVVLLLNKDATQLTQALNEDITGLLADGTIAKALTDNGIDASFAATKTS